MNRFKVKSTSFAPGRRMNEGAAEAGKPDLLPVSRTKLADLGLVFPNREIFPGNQDSR